MVGEGCAVSLYNCETLHYSEAFETDNFPTDTHGRRQRLRNLAVVQTHGEDGAPRIAAGIIG